MNKRGERGRQGRLGVGYKEATEKERLEVESP